MHVLPTTIPAMRINLHSEAFFRQRQELVRYEVNAVRETFTVDRTILHHFKLNELQSPCRRGAPAPLHDGVAPRAACSLVGGPKIEDRWIFASARSDLDRLAPRPAARDTVTIHGNAPAKRDAWNIRPGSRAAVYRRKGRKEPGLRDRNDPMCTLSQNGYGAQGDVVPSQPA